MRVLVGILGGATILVILWDVFETIILPRRVTRRVRLAALFYRFTWRPWSALVRRIRSVRRREAYLSYYGPLSTVLLLSVWAIGMVFAFAMLQWALGSALQAPERAPDFLTDLYMSGTTLFTLGLGDVTPRTGAARLLTVLEGGLGFGLLAIVIGYFPVLYQAFSRREVNISLMDARAGSPSSSLEMLRRYRGELHRLDSTLHESERWTAELLESHLSYPALSYFRSQHDNQSWLSAITTILDTCALVLVGLRGVPEWQAEMTFAIARHAVVDIAQILKRPPRPPESERLSPGDFQRLRAALASADIALLDGDGAYSRLAALRGMYEPYVNALSAYLAMPLPPWIAGKDLIHNWQTSAWGRSKPPAPLPGDDPHAD